MTIVLAFGLGVAFGIALRSNDRGEGFNDALQAVEDYFKSKHCPWIGEFVAKYAREARK